MIQKLGKYSIVEKLGEGSMGAVYRAYDSVLDRYVAIKTMADDIKWDPELKLRFYREARSAANIHHPNIVTIHDLGEEGKITYIVMELLQGTDLKMVIANREPLTLEEKISIIAQVADGLSHAHLHGIFHRDIKPGNIHVSPNGNAKILDFGIARIPSSDLTRMGARLGTPVYMAPEQIRGEEYDAHSDIFAVGIVFYELITYVHPFRDKKIAKTLDNILLEKPLPFDAQIRDAPEGLWPIISKCLAKAPKDRYASMADLARACRDLLDELTLARQSMLKELEAGMPQLRTRADAPGASPRWVELIRDVQKSLTQKEKADFQTLKRLSAALSQDQPPASPLESAPPPQVSRKEEPSSHTDNAVADSLAGSRPRTSGDISVPFRPEENVNPSYPGMASAVRPPQVDAGATAIDTTPAPKETPAAPATENELRGRELVRNAEQSLKEGRLIEAQADLRNAIKLMGPKDDVVLMLAEIRRKLEEKKRAQISQLLETARAAVAGGQFSRAVEALDGVFELVPEQTDAVDLRRQVLAAIEAEKDRQIKKEKGERDKAIGFKLLSEKKFRDSLQALRNAESLLGDDTAVRLWIEEAEEEVQAEELRARAQSELAEALQLFRSQVFDQARMHANRVLELSPKNAEALALLVSIDQAEAKKRDRETLSNLLTRGEQALVRKDFDVALTLANEARQLDPPNQQIAQLLERILQSKEETRRQEEVAQLLVKGEELLSKQDFDEAESQVNQALKVIPDHPKAVEFLNRVRRAREDRRRLEQIIQILGQAEQALLIGNLDQCEGQARRALEIDPGNGKARDILARAGQAREQAKADQIKALLEQGRKALALGDFQRAGTCARDALLLEAKDKEALQLLADIDKAQEKRKRDEIASFFSRAQEAFGRQKFVEAGELAKMVLAQDPKHKDAKALQKEIVKAIRAQENEQKKAQKTAGHAEEATVAPRAPDSSGELERTMIMPKEGGGKAGKLIGLIGLAIVLIGASLGTLYYLKRPQPSPQAKPAAYDVAAQVAAAKSELDQRRYDHAIELAQGILAISPDDSQAHAIIADAQKQKRQAEIDVLMLEIQNLRSDKKTDEALNTIQRVLDIDSAYEPALSVRSEIEAGIATSKGKDEQDKLIRDGLAKIETLLGTGKLAEAKSEIDKIERIRADAPQIPALRQRLGAKATEVARKEEDDKKRKQIIDLSSKAQELFRQGKYNDARETVGQWLAAAPQDEAAQSLRGKTADALASLKDIEDSLTAKQYDEALGAISRLEKVNPSDPNIADLRKRAESSKAAAKAIITVLRINEPGTLTLDDQPIGTGGEVENRAVSVGRHKLEVKFSNGKQNFVEMPFLEGQNVTFVYDSVGAVFRVITPADRETIDKRSQREEIHRYPADHLHLMLKLVVGKCSGELSISGLRFEYKPTEGDHHIVAPFQNLTLSVKDDRLDFTESPGEKQFSFKVKDARQAAAIKKLWDSLRQMGK